MAKNKKPLRIAIAGCGQWTNSLLYCWNEIDASFTLWNRSVEKISNYQNNHKFKIVAELSQLDCDQADLLVIGVASNGFYQVLEQLAPTLKQTNIPVIWLTKGFSSAGQGFLHEVVANLLPPKYPAAALCGPSFASQASEARKTLVSIGFDQTLFKKYRLDELCTSTLSISPFTDNPALCVAGACKNILAIIAGMVDQLNLGINLKAHLIATGFNEIQKLGLNAGANAESFNHPAILGDLILSTYHEQSRNYTLGKKLAKIKDQVISPAKLSSSLSELTEGLNASILIANYIKKHNLNLPLLSLVAQIIEQQSIAPLYILCNDL